MSFVADILVLTVYGDTWALEKHAYAFSMSIIIVNLFVKAVALLVIILIYGELGNSRLPIHYHYQQAAAAQQQHLLLHQQQQQAQQHHGTAYATRTPLQDADDESAGLNDTSLLGLNDTSIANDEGVPYSMHGGPVAYPVSVNMYGSGYQSEGLSSRGSPV